MPLDVCSITEAAESLLMTFVDKVTHALTTKLARKQCKGKFGLPDKSEQRALHAFLCYWEYQVSLVSQPPWNKDLQGQMSQELRAHHFFIRPEKREHHTKKTSPLPYKEILAMPYFLFKLISSCISVRPSLPFTYGPQLTISPIFSCLINSWLTLITI